MSEINTPGLKRLRKTPRAEKVLCDNCKCVRFGKCGCTKKQKVTK
jgi:hypothetical protein